ncbi:hypothetical protein B6U83_01085 [Thermoplasmatales archaeon ex4484_36]|nr:MAG: hypothetical protein B6U83_01085 [Thermoplasmatales archaeon ex4484_36]
MSKEDVVEKGASITARLKVRDLAPFLRRADLKPCENIRLEISPAGKEHVLVRAITYNDLKTSMLYSEGVVDGKVETRMVMSFVTKKLYNILSRMQLDTMLELTQIGDSIMMSNGDITARVYMVETAWPEKDMVEIKDGRVELTTGEGKMLARAKVELSELSIMKMMETDYAEITEKNGEIFISTGHFSAKHDQMTVRFGKMEEGGFDSEILPDFALAMTARFPKADVDMYIFERGVRDIVAFHVLDEGVGTVALLATVERD